MDRLSNEMKRCVAAKENRRKALAAMPYLDKVRAVVQMQRMVVPILKGRDPRATVWKLPN